MEGSSLVANIKAEQEAQNGPIGVYIFVDDKIELGLFSPI
jgi:hypothetical protein